MGLGDAIQIGRSALSAAQLGIQTASNNLANSATPGYSRRTLDLRSVPGGANTGSGQIGLGVEVGSIRRVVDESILTRINQAAGDESAAQVRSDILAEIEANINELTDQDLSSELGAFFSVWSELANGSDTQAIVIEQGERLAGVLERSREDLVRQRSALDDRLDSEIDRLNELTAQIGTVNRTIAETELTGNEANSLRDQRDQLVRELSSLADVTAVPRESGGLDILIGSTPIVQGSRIREAEIRRETRNGSLEISLRVKEDGTTLPATSGTIGELLSGRETLIDATIEDLDSIAAALIFEVNRLHSTGVNPQGLTLIEGTRSLGVGDRTRPLNDPTNATLAALPFNAVNGGFSVVVRDPGTGSTTTTRIDIDLDGIDAAGNTGITDDTSLDDIRAQLDAVAGLTATITSDGRLSIRAADGLEFNLTDDTSGALAVLGVNGYFQGSDASDIRVEQRLLDNPTQLATGSLDREQNFVENGTSLAIAGLQDGTVDMLNGRSIGAFWRDRVQSIGGQASSAQGELASLTAVRESLDAQRLGLSGVNEDEEALNLLAFQRQFQGAARVISTADELLNELLELV
ncbi:MAG: flagellar hook-associated protein FlgK [Planctomycetota bacterium]